MRHQVLILESWSEACAQPSGLGSNHCGFVYLTLLMRPAGVLRSAVVLKTSTLLHFHKMLIKQKYRLLFSPKRVRRPGPKGPTKELIDAVVEMKRRNRTWGCKRIAQQLTLAFGVDIDKDWPIPHWVLAPHPADPRKATATGFVARAAPSRRKRSPKPQRSTNAF